MRNSLKLSVLDYIKIYNIYTKVTFSINKKEKRNILQCIFQLIIIIELIYINKDRYFDRLTHSFITAEPKLSEKIYMKFLDLITLVTSL